MSAKNDGLREDGFNPEKEPTADPQADDENKSEDGTTPNDQTVDRGDVAVDDVQNEPGDHEADPNDFGFEADSTVDDIKDNNLDLNNPDHVQNLASRVVTRDIAGCQDELKKPEVAAAPDKRAELEQQITDSLKVLIFYRDRFAELTKGKELVDYWENKNNINVYGFDDTITAVLLREPIPVPADVVLDQDAIDSMLGGEPVADEAGAASTEGDTKTEDLTQLKVLDVCQPEHRAEKIRRLERELVELEADISTGNSKEIKLYRDIIGKLRDLGEQEVNPAAIVDINYALLKAKIPEHQPSLIANDIILLGTRGHKKQRVIELRDLLSQIDATTLAAQLTIAFGIVVSKIDSYTPEEQALIKVELNRLTQVASGTSFNEIFNIDAEGKPLPPSFPVQNKPSTHVDKGDRAIPVNEREIDELMDVACSLNDQLGWAYQEEKADVQRSREAALAGCMQQLTAKLAELLLAQEKLESEEEKASYQPAIERLDQALERMQTKLDNETTEIQSRISKKVARTERLLTDITSFGDSANLEKEQEETIKGIHLFQERVQRNDRLANNNDTDPLLRPVYAARAQAWQDGIAQLQQLLDEPNPDVDSKPDAAAESKPDQLAIRAEDCEERINTFSEVLERLKLEREAVQSEDPIDKKRVADVEVKIIAEILKIGTTITQWHQQADTLESQMLTLPENDPEKTALLEEINLLHDSAKTLEVLEAKYRLDPGPAPEPITDSDKNRLELLSRENNAKVNEFTDVLVGLALEREDICQAKPIDEDLFNAVIQKIKDKVSEIKTSIDQSCEQVDTLKSELSKLPINDKKEPVIRAEIDLLNEFIKALKGLVFIYNLQITPSPATEPASASTPVPSVETDSTRVEVELPVKAEKITVEQHYFNSLNSVQREAVRSFYQAVNVALQAVDKTLTDSDREQVIRDAISKITDDTIILADLNPKQQERIQQFVEERIQITSHTKFGFREWLPQILERVARRWGEVRTMGGTAAARQLGESLDDTTGLTVIGGALVGSHLLARGLGALEKVSPLVAVGAQGLNSALKGVSLGLLSGRATINLLTEEELQRVGSQIPLNIAKSFFTKWRSSWRTVKDQCEGRRQEALQQVEKQNGVWSLVKRGWHKSVGRLGAPLAQIMYLWRQGIEDGRFNIEDIENNDDLNQLERLFAVLQYRQDQADSSGNIHLFGSSEQELLEAVALRLAEYSGTDDRTGTVVKQYQGARTRQARHNVLGTALGALVGLWSSGALAQTLSPTQPQPDHQVDQPAVPPAKPETPEHTQPDTQMSPEAAPFIDPKTSPTGEDAARRMLHEVPNQAPSSEVVVEKLGQGTGDILDGPLIDEVPPTPPAASPSVVFGHPMDGSTTVGDSSATVGGVEAVRRIIQHHGNAQAVTPAETLAGPEHFDGSHFVAATHQDLFNTTPTTDSEHYARLALGEKLGVVHVDSAGHYQFNETTLQHYGIDTNDAGQLDFSHLTQAGLDHLQQATHEVHQVVQHIDQSIATGGGGFTMPMETAAHEETIGLVAQIRAEHIEQVTTQHLVKDLGLDPKALQAAKLADMNDPLRKFVEAQHKAAQSFAQGRAVDGITPTGATSAEAAEKAMQEWMKRQLTEAQAKTHLTDPSLALKQHLGISTEPLPAVKPAVEPINGANHVLQRLNNEVKPPHQLVEPPRAAAEDKLLIGGREQIVEESIQIAPTTAAPTLVAPIPAVPTPDTALSGPGPEGIDLSGAQALKTAPLPGDHAEQLAVTAPHNLEKVVGTEQAVRFNLPKERVIVPSSGNPSPVLEYVAGPRTTIPLDKDPMTGEFIMGSTASK